MRLLLASASPRRRELLAGIGLPYETVPGSRLDEALVLGHLMDSLSERSTANIASVLRELARLKGDEPARANPQDLVLSADTEVLLDGECLGKPAGSAAACAMLARLSGRWHEVVTAIALQRGGDDLLLRDHAVTRVRFAALSAETIARYVEQEQPFDKAGGYAIQGRGALLIERIEGDYSNVVGLPLRSLAGLLSQAGMQAL